MNEELRLLIESDNFNALIAYLDEQRKSTLEYLVNAIGDDVIKFQERIKFIDELKGYFTYVSPTT